MDSGQLRGAGRSVSVAVSARVPAMVKPAIRTVGSSLISALRVDNTGLDGIPLLVAKCRLFGAVVIVKLCGVVQHAFKIGGIKAEGHEDILLGCGEFAAHPVSASAIEIGEPGTMIVVRMWQHVGAKADRFVEAVEIEQRLKHDPIDIIIA